MPDLSLVINLGSSSLKAALVDSTGASLWHSGRSVAADESLETVLDCWLTPALEPHRQQVTLIGHRVVQGGERFAAPTRITAEVEATHRADSSGATAQSAGPEGIGLGPSMRSGAAAMGLL